MSRALRHWLVARLTDVAVASAPRLSVAGVQRLGSALERVGPWLPGVRGLVAGNMRAAGVLAPEHLLHRYFRELGRHFGGALLAFRAAQRPGGQAELRRLAAEQVELDGSVDRFRARLAGRGAILVGPHICNYLLNLVLLANALPLVVYLRYSKDARRRAAKEQWYRAGAVRWISEPPDSRGPLGRLGSMAEELAAGRVLFITPDLPQKPDTGVPVNFLGRTIYLPAGAGLLAERTGAPVHMLTACSIGGRQRLSVSEACPVPGSGRGRAARREAVQARMQWFASQFDEFVRTAPELWYLWGDKRWTRVFRGGGSQSEAATRGRADPGRT